MLPVALGPQPVSTGLLSPFPEEGNQIKATFISLLSPYHPHPSIHPTTHTPAFTLPPTPHQIHFRLLEVEGVGLSLSPLQVLHLSHTALPSSKHRHLSPQNFSLHLVNPINSITRGGGGDFTKYVTHVRLLHLGLYLLLATHFENLPISTAKSTHLQCQFQSLSYEVFPHPSNPISSLHLSHLKVLIGHLWRRQWHPTPALLPGKSHGRRSLVGCSPWGR